MENYIEINKSREPETGTNTTEISVCYENGKKSQKCKGKIHPKNMHISLYNYSDL